MTASVILSILALYSAGFLFISTGVVALRKFKHDKAERFFGYGILFMGIILGPMMGTRTIFGILGYHTVDFLIAAVDQIFLVASFISLGFYLSYKSFKGKILKTSLAFYYSLGFLVLLVLVYALLTHSYTGPHISKWGTEYEPTGIALGIFLLVWASLVLLNIYFLAGRSFQWLKTKRVNLDFYVGLVLLIFFLFFVFEEAGRMNTWKLVFSRVTSNAIAMTFFLIYTKESFKENKKL